MKILDRSFPSPEENLACDEALLDSCESGESGEVLRFWESDVPFVVLGYSNAAARESKLEDCRRRDIRVLRRVSGGGTVLQGPGCLSYALVLDTALRPGAATVRGANAYVMEKNRAAIERALGKPVTIEGHTDLASDGLKFSGNAQRRRRRAVLFHGTFLLNMDLSLISCALDAPSSEPAYRRGRPHETFLMNLNLDARVVKAALAKEWGAAGGVETPGEALAGLTRRYALDDWNLRY